MKNKKLWIFLSIAIGFVILTSLIYKAGSFSIGKDKTIENSKVEENSGNTKADNSKQKIYDSNGKLTYEGEIKNGKPNGFGKSYYENGNVNYEGEWKDGLYDGVGTIYYEDGKINYKGQLKNGNANGTGKYYNEAGELELQGVFKDNELIEEKSE
ncbi:MORN repeat protein [Clostridium homopropionicum DSM 5847]|uniref:MORN repeat protein n=1 Tax=Clostridium homopropionicum DSM 5847 TaxID=1121318 RepID=A0A0L6ZCD9_9CLOT|nr:hypothetical protein [Clostridium homopropionicum]KOA20631.1 MORN repeat protein [Clostridium homopropionicum DSM 5847]SFF92738.1 MORN repeat-containing protein [Clostridium homopropionicum]